MRTKELVCILCPNGCQLKIEIGEGNAIDVGNISGNICEKGPQWAKQEILNPVRSISSSVLVKGGMLPLVSVKTDTPIPRDKIFDVMREIKKLILEAPVCIGDRLLENPAGTACTVVATRDDLREIRE